MALKLKYTPLTFQRAVDVSLTNVDWQLAIVYLEHILIVSRMPDKQGDDALHVLMLFDNVCHTLTLNTGLIFTDHIESIDVTRGRQTPQP